MLFDVIDVPTNSVEFVSIILISSVWRIW